MVIHISVSGPGSTAKTSLNVKMLTLIKPPPNPVADDRNDSYHMATVVPSRAVKSLCVGVSGGLGGRNIGMAQ